MRRAFAFLQIALSAALVTAAAYRAHAHHADPAEGAGWTVDVTGGASR